MVLSLSAALFDQELQQALRRRFYEKIKVVEGGCHEWTGAKTPYGYGVIGFGPRYGHKTLYAHRVALWFASGSDGKDAIVMHSCDNPSCCNPAHLSYGTFKANAADMLAKGRECRGERSPQAKLSECEVRAIRKDPRSLSAIARDYGVDIKQIHRIKRRENWKHVA
jgi:hypothetical protein